MLHGLHLVVVYHSLTDWCHWSWSLCLMMNQGIATRWDTFAWNFDDWALPWLHSLLSRQLFNVWLPGREHQTQSGTLLHCQLVEVLLHVLLLELLQGYLELGKPLFRCKLRRSRHALDTLARKQTGWCVQQDLTSCLCSQWYFHVSLNTAVKDSFLNVLIAVVRKWRVSCGVMVTIFEPHLLQEQSTLLLLLLV